MLQFSRSFRFCIGVRGFCLVFLGFCRGTAHSVVNLASVVWTEELWNAPFKKMPKQDIRKRCKNRMLTSLLGRFAATSPAATGRSRCRSSKTFLRRPANGIGRSRKVRAFQISARTKKQRGPRAQVGRLQPTDPHLSAGQQIYTQASCAKMMPLGGLSSPVMMWGWPAVGRSTLTSLKICQECLSEIR